MKFDAIIIGAGAAGLFCAIEAGKRGRRVLVLEHNAQVGRKILISGGGRCNFTNRDVRAENFISNNPHFCKSALARYTAQDFIELVKKHRIEFYEKKLGQLFCRESSRQIVEMLLEECRAAKVEIRTDCSVKNVEKKELFEIETNQGNFTGASLVIATGGLSFPKVGATNFGYRIARQFGLKIVETKPALVPLVFSKDSQNFKQLAGVSVDSVVTSGKQSFRENILFTHRGLSGPAILQISNYLQKNKPVSIDLLPEKDALELLQNNHENRQRLDNFLSAFLPKGKTSGTLTGNLREGQIAEYVFGATKKKLVFIRLNSVKPKGRFHSFFVKGDAIDFQSERERLEVEKFQAPETGDYFIFVQFKPSGKVRQGSYKLTLEFKN